MKNKQVTKNTDLDDFRKFEIDNPKIIFGGGDGDIIDKKKLRRPGMQAG